VALTNSTSKLAGFHATGFAPFAAANATTEKTASKATPNRAVVMVIDVKQQVDVGRYESIPAGDQEIKQYPPANDVYEPAKHARTTKSDAKLREETNVRDAALSVSFRQRLGFGESCFVSFSSGTLFGRYS